jgi:MFS family permease
MLIRSRVVTWLLWAIVLICLFGWFNPRHGHRPAYLVAAILVVIGWVALALRSKGASRQSLVRLQFNVLLWMLCAGVLVGIFEAVPPWNRSWGAYLVPACMALVGGVGVALQWKRMFRKDQDRATIAVSLAAARARRKKMQGL